jgi:hypothetical protein
MLGKGSSSSSNDPTSSAFQNLFHDRARGFQIEFAFRNAPPRPPVGPTFVGSSLSTLITEQCRQYKPHNAVEMNHTWKLHSEPDLGIPIAPSAMDLESYNRPDESVQPKLHPDDEALINWKGSLGDTAAENMKRRLERKRAATRLALSGRTPKQPAPAINLIKKKKEFSRVLNEGMQTWMKKTTYLSNDYSKKVHDFKSLAQTKQDLAEELQIKQVQMTKRRSTEAIMDSFSTDAALVHPTKKHLKAKCVLPLLPNVDHWGNAYTHVVIDKAPMLQSNHDMADLDRAYIAHVEKKKQAANSARMSSSLLVPLNNENDYQVAQSYDLDVVPLKDEDAPAVHFCIWMDRTNGTATYLPISSRVQLANGAPIAKGGIRQLYRRPRTAAELADAEERMAEVDADMSEKHHIRSTRYNDNNNDDDDRAIVQETRGDAAATNNGSQKATTGEEDEMDDFGDDDSSDSGDEALFGTKKTIVAEG